MDKEKAIAKAEAFKDDWEIDRLEGTAYHKPTGFKLSLGAVWRDEKGERQFEVLHWYEKNIPGAKQDMKEVNRLLKEFGILYEAGYMPPLTKEEQEEEWRRTHPEEFQKQIEENLKAARKCKAQWYIDHDLPVPDKFKDHGR